MVDGSSTGSPSTSHSGFPPDLGPVDLHTEHIKKDSLVILTIMKYVLNAAQHVYVDTGEL